MSITAIILAGGSGTRMGQNKPKQFIDVLGKPILVYTLEVFQNHPLIESVEVVFPDGWQKAVWEYADQYGIEKLKFVVAGGETALESIRNGVVHLEGKVSEEDIIIIHDGIRPLIDEMLISDVIVKAQKYGNAVSSLPYNEQIFIIHDNISTEKYIPRETLRRVMTPQAYKYGKLKKAFREAFERGIGIHESSYANTLMADFGERLYFSVGSERNIKLTTKEDLEMFKAYLQLTRKMD